jgi:hypothetical protein
VLVSSFPEPHQDYLAGVLERRVEAVWLTAHPYNIFPVVAFTAIGIFVPNSSYQLSILYLIFKPCYTATPEC